MELIIPKAEIWEQGNTLEDMWKHIARCTRVCYQSTPKNDGETDEEFVKRVIFRVNKLKGESTDKYIKRVDELSSKGKLNWDNLHGAMLEHGTVYLFVPWLDDVNASLPEVVKHYCNNAYSKENYSYDKLGSYITTNLRVIYENGWLADLQYLCSSTEYHAKRITVSFILESVTSFVYFFMLSKNLYVSISLRQLPV